eukprot:8234649-Lingulodinium_polyedra.AAC.1
MQHAACSSQHRTFSATRGLLRASCSVQRRVWRAQYASVFTVCSVVRVAYTVYRQIVVVLPCIFVCAIWHTVHKLVGTSHASKGI